MASKKPSSTSFDLLGLCDELLQAIERLIGVKFQVETISGFEPSMKAMTGKNSGCNSCHQYDMVSI